ELLGRDVLGGRPGDRVPRLVLSAGGLRAGLRGRRLPGRDPPRAGRPARWRPPGRPPPLVPDGPLRQAAMSRIDVCAVTHEYDAGDRRVTALQAVSFTAGASEV